MEWNLKTNTVPKTVDELINALLEIRGIQPEDLDLFLTPQHPHDISLSQVKIDEKAMQTAVDRLLQAKTNEETVVVFGDYDADGVCATAVVWEALHRVGIKAVPFIPHREKHGYGISDAALDDLLAEMEPAVVVTVDNGIVAHGPVARLVEAGLDVIITDHHQPEDELPPATAIVQTDKLCGTTVGWMLAREILKADGQNVSKDWGLDLAAIATVADQVPLQGANRSFAYHGVKVLKRTKRPGIKALLEQANIDLSKLSASTIGYAIAPRINAMGRLDHSLDALRLLCTTDPTRATSLSLTLADMNKERQDLTYSMVDDAIAQLKDDPVLADKKLLVVHSPDYHEGVIGLIAGRLVEKFHRPAIVMTTGDGVVKGSARSIEGVNIVELIRSVREHLDAVGGHPMAAGFSTTEDKIETLTEALDQVAKEEIDPELLQPKLDIDLQLAHDLVTVEMAEALEGLEPFGQTHPEPMFSLPQVKILEVNTIGREGKHLKLLVELQNQEQLPVLAWRRAWMADQLQVGMLVNLAGMIQANRWNGRTSVQLVMRDVQGES